MRVLRGDEAAQRTLFTHGASDFSLTYAIDPLTAWFLLVLAVVGAPIAIFSIGYVATAHFDRRSVFLGVAFNVLLAAYQTLLHRYTGKEELLVGSVMAGRDHPDLAELAGYLINPVALPADFSSGPTFLELLAQVRGAVLGAFEHQSYPPALLAERLELPRDLSRPPLSSSSASARERAAGGRGK